MPASPIDRVVDRLSDQRIRPILRSFAQRPRINKRKTVVGGAGLPERFARYRQKRVVRSVGQERNLAPQLEKS